MNRNCAGAHMICNSSHSSAIIGSGHIFPAAGVRHCLDDRFENIDVEVAINALEHRAGAFQSHAGINVATREWSKIAGRRSHAIKLRKDKVPDFYVTAVWHAIKNFAAWTANPIGPLSGGTSRPEVVIFTHPHDFPSGQTHFIRPDGVCLVVILVDSDGKFFGCNA